MSKTPEGFELFDSDMMNRYKFDNQMRLVRIENLLQNQGKPRVISDKSLAMTATDLKVSFSMMVVRWRGTASNGPWQIEYQAERQRHIHGSSEKLKLQPTDA